MASCLDDGLGTRQETQGQTWIPPRVGEGQELRLGGMEKEVLEAPQQQEITRHGLVQEAGRGW